jgi:hypothetical protein
MRSLAQKRKAEDRHASADSELTIVMILSTYIIYVIDRALTSRFEV